MNNYNNSKPQQTNYNGIQVRWLGLYNEIITEGGNMKPIPLIGPLAFKAKMSYYLRVFVLH